MSESDADSATSARIEALTAALEASEHRFRVVVDGAPDGVVIVRDDRLLYVNAVAATLLGFDDSASALGAPLTQRLHPHDRELARRRMASISKAPHAERSAAEYRTLPVGGRARRFEVSSLPIDYQGAPSILSFLRETTERHENQRKLLRADRLAALGTLSAGMAHELSSPLSYMQLNLEHLITVVPGLARGPAVDEILAQLQDVRHAAERLASLVRDLRLFTRGGDDHARSDVDVAQVIANAIKMLRPQVEGKITFVVTSDDPPPVQSNFAQLGQVFLNLLLNAVQAMDQDESTGEVRVEVSHDADVVYVHVVDEGPGMDPEILDRVFDPFFTTKPVGVGTGLGLPICRGLVESLGGDLQVESSPGTGTRCIVALPRQRHSDDLDSGPDATASSPPRRDRRAHHPLVLVVDDERRLAQTVSLLLSDDYDVVVTNSAEEARDHLSTAEPPDAILCDLTMPGMGGIGFYQHLLKAMPHLAPRLAFMTGGSASFDRPTDPTLMGRPILEKPFSTEALLGVLARLLGG